MKVCTIQPLYPTDYSRSEEMFLREMEAMDKCDDTMDLIVLPESTDVPCFAKTRDMAMESYKKFNEKLIKNVILFAVGNIGSKLLQVILVPLYTRVMTNSEYGTVIGTALLDGKR